MEANSYSRRRFLSRTLQAGIGLPVAARCAADLFAAESAGSAARPGPAGQTASSAVAVVSCKSYGAEVRSAFDRCFDLLGGIAGLVKGKTVAVKLNLTGTSFGTFLGKSVGETYMTHPATVSALAAALFAAGAKRVRLLESTNSRASLESTLSLADWDVRQLSSLGQVEFENTRNLGSGKSYAHLTVPRGGYMFSTFDLNHSYSDADVMVSFAKLKNHVTAGVTLSMKNMFGATPNALYGDEAGNEDATAGRFPLHGGAGFGEVNRKVKLPGLKPDIKSTDSTWRIPRIVADICAARPVHLAIIDGITSVSGGEGPWCGDGIKFTSPGVLIAGLNPVSTDAVGTAVMGYANPRAARGEKPFHFCDNHLLLAEQAGVGTADLARIDVRGLSIQQAQYPYP